jgi:hypothetical protein
MPTPDWKKDYAAALSEGKKARKPLAVFVGRGSDGWSQVSESTKLGPDVRGLLGEYYVCLYVDLDDRNGQQLAADLSLSTDSPGLVISDSTGEMQAFRHSGKLDPEVLSRYLRTYSDPDRAVTRTEMHGRQEIRYYPSDSSAPRPGGVSYPVYSSPNCRH